MFCKCLENVIKIYDYFPDDIKNQTKPKDTMDYQYNMYIRMKKDSEIDLDKMEKEFQDSLEAKSKKEKLEQIAKGTNPEEEEDKN